MNNLFLRSISPDKKYSFDCKNFLTPGWILSLVPNINFKYLFLFILYEEYFLSNPIFFLLYIRSILSKFSIRFLSTLLISKYTGSGKNLFLEDLKFFEIEINSFLSTNLFKGW